ncbi:hypothetical protein FHT76_007595 [Rhizobium sp. BK176]|nr:MULTISPECIES: hypothetical protein [unclassified Rhizobium]MCS3743349.1 hypothetical protein [Rhizobium sp. BK661]MCS4095874.1 hypothetical protein [Rhizobium sp. BK176]
MVDQTQHHIDAVVVDTHFIGEIGNKLGSCTVDLPKYWPTVLNDR